MKVKEIWCLLALGADEREGIRGKQSYQIQQQRDHQHLEDLLALGASDRHCCVLARQWRRTSRL